MSALVLGLPSKGRLQEQVIAFLADAGLKLKQSRGARDYAAKLEGFDDITVSLLSAAEIAEELHTGRVHLGVSGEDLLRERASGAGRMHVVERLGFGHANVVVAVPRSWIDVSTMADLDDVASGFHVRHHRRLRVATKFVNLTRDFFASRGISDYRIVESTGATEGAPAAGTAEAIVDITTTGTTLAQNDLKILDDGLILESQAVLAASLTARWNDPARNTARTLFERLAARALAKRAQIVRVRIDPFVETALPALERDLGAKVLSRPAAGNAAGEAAILVPDENLTKAVAILRGQGAQSALSVQRAEYVFTPENALYANLEIRLPR
jgi:ATP phosphoribosyltransferase